MSVESPQRHDSQDRHRRETDRADVRTAAARVAAWLATSPDDDPPARPESLDRNPRHRDVVNPAAARIGYPEDETDDLPERLRALHAERDARLRGNDERQLRLDVARVTQAVCNSLDLTTWERDRVLGVVCELDPSAVADRHAISHVALVVARRVVDAERRAWLGLEDESGLDGEPPERLDALAEWLHRISDGEAFERLRDASGLSPGAATDLEARLVDELDESTLQEAVFGRSPYRDPALPPFEHAVGSAGPE